MNHGTRAGAAEIRDDQDVAVWGNLVLADNVDVAGSLLGFEHEVGFEAEKFAVVQSAGADGFGGVARRVGTEVPVVDPPALRHDVHFFGEVEWDGVSMGAAATTERAADGELSAFLSDVQLAATPGTEVGALVAIKLPGAEKGGRIKRVGGGN